MCSAVHDPTHPRPASVPERLRVLGVPVDAVNMEGALAAVDQWVHTLDRPGYVVAVNPEKVYAVRGNAFLNAFLDRASLLIPDGVGMIWALRFLFGKRVHRVAGADLMQNICARSPERGYRIFIYGGEEAVNAGAVEELRRRHPGIQIVGRAHGYLTDAELPALVQTINDSGADVLFVALGSPRQEQWLQRWLPELKVKVCQGIGGTLDTIIGRVKRAPVGWQRLGLEWLYRLLKQPARAGRQYRLLLFVGEVMLAKLGWRRT